MFSFIVFSFSITGWQKRTCTMLKHHLCSLQATFCMPMNVNLANIIKSSEPPSCFEEVVEEVDRSFDLPFLAVLPGDDFGSALGRLRWA